MIYGNRNEAGLTDSDFLYNMGNHPNRRVRMHRNYSLSRIFISAVFFIVSACGAVCAAEPVSPPATRQVENNDQVLVARVNGAGITSRQLKRGVDALLATEPSAELPQETMKKVRKNVLEDLIDRELFHQAGMQLEIKDLENLVKAKVGALKSSYASDAYFQEALKSKGMDEKDAYDDARSSIVINNFIEKTIDPKIVVTDDECRKVYEKNIEKFTQPEQVRISHILIKADASMTSEEKKKARAQAEEIRNLLMKGAGFVELARKYSSAPDNKLGGDLGYLSKDQLPSPLRVAFSLKTGELSEIVESRAGYDIIKVRDHRRAVATSFDKAKPEIEDYLKKVKKEWALQEYIKGAREKAKIELLLN